MSKHKLNEFAQQTNNQFFENGTTCEAANQHKRLDLQLRAVCECDYSIVHADEEQKLLSEICRILCVTARYKLAWVGIVVNDENKALRPWVWYATDDQALNTNPDLTENEDGQGPAIIAIRTGKTQFFKDLAA